jgi:hypothetical protein
LRGQILYIESASLLSLSCSNNTGDVCPIPVAQAVDKMAEDRNKREITVFHNWAQELCGSYYQDNLRGRNGEEI